jgi:GLPGLI family protein
VFRKYKDKRQVEQIGFMTKTFLVDSDLKRVSWKLTHMKKQVLEYECMGAEIKEGEETVTAYFSPEIPASVGPAKYYGLPGAILSIEINGNPMIIASSIQLGKVGDPISIDAPQDGKRMSLQEFEILVEEKTKEYNTNMDAKAKSKAKKPIKN